MCGRFTLTQDIQTVARTIMSPKAVAIPSTLQVVPRYNIAPTQDVVTVMNDGNLHLDMLRWGLIPSWSKVQRLVRDSAGQFQAIKSAPSYLGSLTRRETGLVAISLLLYGTNRGNRACSSCNAGSSQVSRASGVRMAGMRL